MMDLVRCIIEVRDSIGALGPVIEVVDVDEEDSGDEVVTEVTSEVGDAAVQEVDQEALAATRKLHTTVTLQRI